MKKKIFQKITISDENHDAILGNPKLSNASGEENAPDHIISFGRNATIYRSFNLSEWYGVGIDALTLACHQQILRFLNKQDSILAIPTIVGLCRSGIRSFLTFATTRRTLLDKELSLEDIDRKFINSYLEYLKNKGLNAAGQRSKYNAIKSILVELVRRGLIKTVEAGENALFPLVPFPNANNMTTSAIPLSKDERTKLAIVLRRAIAPIWDEGVILTTHLLSCVLIVIALYTGRNTTPLLEMSRDCLHDHPKPGRKFLVLWKRRGHNTSKVAIKSLSEEEPEKPSTLSVNNNIERLINRVLQLTADLALIAPPHLQSRALICLSGAPQSRGKIVTITSANLHRTFKTIGEEMGLSDLGSLPTRINISRLRKAFANRVFEILNGDLAATSIALGNTPKVTGDYYLVPDETAKRNWRFMGEILVSELLSNTIGDTYKDVPTGKCNHSHQEGHESKNAGAACINFLGCLKCKHYAITGEDLYKLYSFYFRVYKERNKMNKARWARELSHIPRLIDNYIITEGIRRKIFKQEQVDHARELARTNPHPFWANDTLSTLEILS